MAAPLLSGTYWPCMGLEARYVDYPFTVSTAGEYVFSLSHVCDEGAFESPNESYGLELYAGEFNPNDDCSNDQIAGNGDHLHCEPEWAPAIVETLSPGEYTLVVRTFGIADEAFYRMAATVPDGNEPLSCGASMEDQQPGAPSEFLDVSVWPSKEIDIDDTPKGITYIHGAIDTIGYPEPHDWLTAGIRLSDEDDRYSVEVGYVRFHENNAAAHVLYPTCIGQYCPYTIIRFPHPGTSPEECCDSVFHVMIDVGVPDVNRPQPWFSLSREFEDKHTFHGTQGDWWLPAVGGDGYWTELPQLIVESFDRFDKVWSGVDGSNTDITIREHGHKEQAFSTLAVPPSVTYDNGGTFSWPTGWCYEAVNLGTYMDEDMVPFEVSSCTTAGSGVGSGGQWTMSVNVPNPAVP